MASLPFLDTNVLLRHFVQDDPVFSPKASAIIARIEQGELTARTSDIVIFETVFSMQRFYRLPRPEIADIMLNFVELPGIILPGKRRYRRVFELYRTSPLGFADCYHVVLMQQLGINEVLSFDHDFDRVRDIRRREA